MISGHYKNLKCYENSSALSHLGKEEILGSYREAFNIKGWFEGFKKALEQYRGDIAHQGQRSSAMDQSKDKLYGLRAELGLMSEFFYTSC